MTKLPTPATGTIFGVYTYHGRRVYRIRFPKGDKLPDAYVNEELQPVAVHNTNDLHTIQVTIDGDLKDPWKGLDIFSRADINKSKETI